MSEKPVTRRVRFVAIAAAAALTAVAGLVAGAPTARADNTIDTYTVSGQVAADGTVSVSTAIVFAGTAPAQFTQRLANRLAGENYTYYQYDISNVTATAGGADLKPSVTTDRDYTVITVDTSGLGSNPLVVGYQVKGAATSGGVTGGGIPITSISWPVLQGLTTTVNTAGGSLGLANGVSILSVDCKSGSPAGLQPCQWWAGGTHDAWNPSFGDANVGPGSQVVLSFTVPTSAVAVNQQVVQMWTLDRAFSTALGPLLAALLTLLVGAALLFWLYRGRGRDVKSSREPTVVASFVPSGKGTVEFDIADHIRPGHVGTVVDERVDPVDIAATLLDLAVRGHLQIIELAPAKPGGQADWTFKRLASEDPIRPFETRLLDAVAPESGEAAVVSRISAPVEAVIADVQHDLYEEVVERGWFSRRPDQVRHLFDLLGWIAVGVAVVALALLVAFTHYGLLGLVLLALAIGLLAIAQTMPRRTPAGVDLLNGMHVLSMALQTQPTGQIPKQTAYAEISKILPYAVVLGGRSRWVQALADADDDPEVPDPDDLTWYHAPANWNLSDLPHSLDGFITNMCGRLLGRD